MNISNLSFNHSKFVHEKSGIFLHCMANVESFTITCNQIPPIRERYTYCIRNRDNIFCVLPTILDQYKCKVLIKRDIAPLWVNTMNVVFLLQSYSS